MSDTPTPPNPNRKGIASMSAGAQLSVTDQRRMTRHPVDHPVIAEHFGKGDVRLHIANISANGFMVDNGDGIGRGERVIVRLPAGSKPIASGRATTVRASSSNASSASTTSSP
jgi:hypothetical protein